MELLAVAWIAALIPFAARAVINIAAMGFGLLAFLTTDNAILKTYPGPDYFNVRRLLVLLSIVAGATIHLLTLAVLSALAQRLGLLPL